MRIELDESEIEQAICQYITTLGFALPGSQQYTVSMKAGRGPKGGHTASISLGEAIGELGPIQVEEDAPEESVASPEASLFQESQID